MEPNSLNGKYFKFNVKEDFIFYLAELITDLIQKRDRLEGYGEEVKLIFKNNPNAKFIQSEKYWTISDKTNRVFQYLFNLIGDESKKAVSYRKFRKKLFKQKSDLKIDIEKLPQGEEENIGEFNKLRNWGLHIAKSIFLQKKAFLKIDSKFIMENKKTIPIPVYDYFEIQYLFQLGSEIQEVLNATNQVLKRMKDGFFFIKIFFSASGKESAETLNQQQP